MAKDKELKCEIVKEYGRFGNKLYGKISWNDGEARDEIRNVIVKDGKERLGKGLAINDEEMDELIKLFKQKKDSEPKAVDFSEIFSSAGNIVQHRQEGYTTTNGFIKLKRKTK